MKRSPIMQSLPWWGGGIATAALGVVCTRIVAPHFAESMRAAISVGGQLLALAGLIVIAFGVQRRVHARATPEETARD